MKTCSTAPNTNVDNNRLAFRARNVMTIKKYLWRIANIWGGGTRVQNGSQVALFNRYSIECSYILQTNIKDAYSVQPAPPYSMNIVSVQPDHGLQWSLFSQ